MHCPLLESSLREVFGMQADRRCLLCPNILASFAKYIACENFTPSQSYDAATISLHDNKKSLCGGVQINYTHIMNALK